MQRQEELNKRKEFLSSSSLEDYLSEDPPVHNQNFFILSYLLPGEKNELAFPTIKVRGSFKSQEDCQKRIEKLKNIDPYFNMYVCEVGKFGSLLPEDEIQNNEDIDIQYREAMLNDMVKQYQENKDKSDLEFEKRKKLLKERAAFEGTKEGQELLAKQKENPVAVKNRIESMSKHLEELNERIAEVQDIIKMSEEQLSSFTEEELSELKITEEGSASHALASVEASVVREEDVKGKGKA